MRWKITTEKSTYMIRAFSSADAVKQVQKHDSTKVIEAKLMPKDTVDKLQTTWRRWFGK